MNPFITRHSEFDETSLVFGAPEGLDFSIQQIKPDGELVYSRQYKGDGSILSIPLKSGVGASTVLVRDAGGEQLFSGKIRA
jgi:hypothetical protein